MPSLVYLFQRNNREKLTRVHQGKFSRASYLTYVFIPHSKHLSLSLPSKLSNDLSRYFSTPRSFINLMNNARDQTIRALRVFFKALPRLSHPSKLPLPLFHLPFFSLSLVSRSIRMYVYVRPKHAEHNFIPTISVAYSSCECHWEFDVSLPVEISL